MSPGTLYTFGPFELDGRGRLLRRDGEQVPITDRYLSVLLHLAMHAGATVPKNDLVVAGWGDVAVTDNSLEQAISALRRLLGNDPLGRPYVETVPRQGYRLTAAVARSVSRESDEAIDALLAPHRALIDGRAALESLEREQVLRARDVFTEAVAMAPDQASPHVGLANACVLQFEMSRTDLTPDGTLIRVGADHAREACRLDPQNGEAWATLGFVLERAGDHTDALAASRRAVALEPDNWRHHFRLSSIAWGEERLRAARRTLELLPGLSLAHWLAATVAVARQTLDDAARELRAGIAGESQGQRDSRFSGVALHWLLGLIYLTRGDESAAMEEFERELSAEGSGHLYARECCANTWYAIGALHFRHGRPADAAEAFKQATERVPTHPMARLGLGLTTSGAGSSLTAAEAPAAEGAGTVETMLGRAAWSACRGSEADGAQLVEAALTAAPPGNAAWLLPIEPLLNVSAAPAVWAAALTRLRIRAA